MFLLKSEVRDKVTTTFGIKGFENWNMEHNFVFLIIQKATEKTTLIKKQNIFSVPSQPGENTRGIFRRIQKLLSENPRSSREISPPQENNSSRFYRGFYLAVKARRISSFFYKMIIIRISKKKKIYDTRMYGFISLVKL